MKIKCVAHIEFEMEVSDSSTPDEIRTFLAEKQYCDGDSTIVNRLQRYHDKVKAEGKCICDTTVVELLGVGMKHE